MNKTENVGSEINPKMWKIFVCVMNKKEYDEGISKKIMYIRMRQGLFLALSDVIDAFVVAGKHTSEKSQRKTK